MKSLKYLDLRTPFDGINQEFLIDKSKPLHSRSQP